MTGFYIFLIRVAMAVVFAILVTRLFYPDAGMVKVMLVTFVMVGMAYIFESFRKRTKGPK
ncbi:MAG: hypothetical protein JRI70_07445 [Deltaproteobacteria bacterium]|nr:hypothetical protein [Deltaproteobacteria bacterium]MBW1859895.1 hypothetical protein [Deltaproteobacteria bacterium]